MSIVINLSSYLLIIEILIFVSLNMLTQNLYKENTNTLYL